MARNQQLKQLKDSLESLNFLIDQIEHLEEDLAIKLEVNKSVPDRYSKDELNVNIRYIDGYFENINKVINQISQINR